MSEQKWSGALAEIKAALDAKDARIEVLNSSLADAYANANHCSDVAQRERLRSDTLSEIVEAQKRERDALDAELVARPVVESAPPAIVATEHAQDALVYSQFDASKHVAPLPTVRINVVDHLGQPVSLDGYEATASIRNAKSGEVEVTIAPHASPADERVTVYAKLFANGESGAAIWSQSDMERHLLALGEKWLALDARVVREGGA